MYEDLKLRDPPVLWGPRTVTINRESVEREGIHVSLQHRPCLYGLRFLSLKTPVRTKIHHYTVRLYTDRPDPIVFMTITVYTDRPDYSEHLGLIVR